VVPAVLNVTPLKVATPADNVPVMVAEPLLENVDCGEPEAMPRVTESVEFLATLLLASSAVAVTVKATPTFCEATVAMARLATVEDALTVKLPVEPVLPDGEVTEVTVKEVDWAS
jgi:hypothetical protein